MIFRHKTTVGINKVSSVIVSTNGTMAFETVVDGVNVGRREDNLVKHKTLSDMESFHANAVAFLEEATGERANGL